MNIQRDIFLKVLFGFVFYFLDIYTFNINFVAYELRKIDKDLLNYVINNDYDKVEECLRLGANVDVKDIYFRSPLILAASNYDEKMVNILLKYNADINIPNLLLETPLIIACNSGIENLAHLLLDNGADPHLYDSLKRNALFYACRSNMISVVSRLLKDFKMDINKKDIFNEYLIVALMAPQFIDLLDLLFDYGANPNICDIYNNSLLMLSLKYDKSLRLYDLLISKGANNLDVKNYDGENIFDIAKRYNIKDILNHISN